MIKNWYNYKYKNKKGADMKRFRKLGGGGQFKAYPTRV
jgi:hypothetical protein